MSTNLERFKNDIIKLNKLGEEMYFDLNFQTLEKNGELEDKYKEVAKRTNGSFRRNYQKWYTEACAVLKQLIPDRLAEFIQLYCGDGKKNEFNAETYHIQNWLNGLDSAEDYFGKREFSGLAVITMRFDTQRQILKSAEARFESSLFDMAQLVRADLFDSELDASRELTKQGFLRAAGAVVGVVIEKHLSQVCVNHNVAIKKKDPTINDFNDALKNATVLDVPGMRHIQRLADIRNLCDHNKHRDPTKDEVTELINGADKLCKTLF
jgi:hypothetical protein